MDLRQIGRGLSALNVATLIRAARCGLRDGLDKGRRAYATVDPFGAPVSFDELAKIPVISLGDLLDSVSPAGIEATEAVPIDPRHTHADGSLGLEELVALLAAARQANPRAVLEIGTFCGSTTRALAESLPDATIHTIDLPPEFSGTADPSSMSHSGMPMDDLHLIESRRLGSHFANTPQAKRIVQHLGNTADYPFNSIPDPLSFFFIDGSHTYEFAKNDSLRCMAVAAGESTMMWHDTNESHPGVLRWVNEMRDAGLNVRRIDRTSLSHLRFSPNDPAIRSLLSASGGRL